MQIIKVLLVSIFIAALSLSVAFAAEVQVKGKATTKFESGLFSKKPSAKMKEKTIKAAKTAAWKRFTASFNAAKLRSYKAMEAEFLRTFDEYIIDYSIVDEFTDKATKGYTVIILMSVDATAIDAKLSANSAAGTQMGEGSYFTFVFVAREAESRTSFKEKETNISTAEARVASEESIASGGGTTVSGTSAKSASKTVTGGSTVKKSDKVVYRTESSSDINSAMSEQLTVAGFEVVEYVDVASDCGGVEVEVMESEFTKSEKLSRKTRESAFGASRDCDVSFFAIGTLDVGINDVDPVSGMQRVYVSAKAVVYNLAKRLPKKVASVRPTQFAGIGPDASVARRNALNLAGEKAASIIVDQLNMKNLR